MADKKPELLKAKVYIVRARFEDESHIPFELIMTLLAATETQAKVALTEWAAQYEFLFTGMLSISTSDENIVDARPLGNVQG